MTWKKTGKRIGPDGTTISYELPGCPMRIESRKRHIPHANRSGTWEHTSYFVLRGEEVIAEKQTLADAKILAERYMMDRGLMEEDEV